MCDRPPSPAAFDVRVTRPLDAFRLDVSLHTESTRVGILGPSGSGKSTLIRILAGVDTEVVGRISVGGQVWLDSDRGRWVPPWARGVGWVPQDMLLFPHLSVRDNLVFGVDPALAEGPRIDDIVNLLEIDGLLERRPRRISGGERQRVAVGRALLSNPRLLLMDEPFAALDRPLRSRVVPALTGHLERRALPTIVVAHDTHGLEPLIDEWWSMSDGRLVREAQTPAEA